MGNFVEKGDIIRLKKGMMICTSIPEKVYCYDKPLSTEKIDAVIEIGKIYQSVDSTKENIKDNIRSFLIDIGVKTTERQIGEIADFFDTEYEAEELDTSKYEGSYVVSDAGYENEKDDQYKVTCFKITDPTIKAVFYQNKPLYCRNCIPEVEVIGKYKE